MNKVRLSIFFLLTALAAYPSVAVDRARSVSAMIPDAVHDDFESGELNAWESYPIAQDPGFDPETWCVREPAFGGSRYSLSKVFEPNDTDWPRDENLVGMTKKTRIWTRADTTLSLAVFAEGDRRPAEIRVVLYGGDGSMYIWSQAAPKANEWLSLRLSRTDSGTHPPKYAPYIPLPGGAVSRVRLLRYCSTSSDSWSARRSRNCRTRGMAHALNSSGAPTNKIAP